MKDNPEVFSGMVWTGAKSVELGLADALGNADYVAREVIQAERIVDFTVQQGIAERFARRIGRVATDFLSETRFTWFMR